MLQQRSTLDGTRRV